MNNDEAKLLRSIKKTAVVLLTLIKLNRPSGEKELSEILDISQETMRGYLRSLQRVGLVGKISRYRGWIITGIGSQLVLPEISASAEFPRSNAEIPRSHSHSLTTTMLIKDSNINSEIVVETESGNAESALNVKDLSTTTVDNSEVWAALERAGIQRNQRTERLVNLEHITAAYIDRHWRRLVKMGKGSETGLLVSILESGQDAPGDNDLPYVKENRHDKSCDCEECRGYYADWED
jgi:hypothetical protein